MGERKLETGDRFPVEDLRPRAAPDLWEPGSPAVVYFYVQGDTPTCMNEALAFNERDQAFRDAGLQVIGVSVDRADTQAVFAREHGLRFPLAADPERALTNALGITRTLADHPEVGVVPQRVTFLLDPEGVILRIWDVDDVVGHPDQVLAEARHLLAGTGPARPEGRLG